MSKAPQPARRHHYVPQFLLKQWAGADGRLERYDRPVPGKTMVRRVAPSEVGFQRDLYTSPDEQQREAAWLENQFLQRVDSMAALSHAKMMRSPPATLNAAELSAWSVFVRTLFHRTPEALNAYQSSGMKIWSETVAGVGERYPELRAQSDPETLQEYIDAQSFNDVYRTVLDTFPTQMVGTGIGQYLNNMYRMIVDFPEDLHPLLISDAVPIRTDGFEKPDGHYAIPLSPRRLLVASRYSEMNERVKSIPAKVLLQSVNSVIVGGARRFVSAIDRTQTRFIENRFGTSPYRALME